MFTKAPKYPFCIEIWFDAVHGNGSENIVVYRLPKSPISEVMELKNVSLSATEHAVLFQIIVLDYKKLRTPNFLPFPI